MRLGYKFSVLSSVAVCLAPFQATSQKLSGAKVCVAVVNNHTAELLTPDRMTVRLVKAVSDKKLSAVAMDSSTGNSKELRPTLENSQEMKSKECDYLLLTMVTGSSKRAGSSSDAGISIGHARVPSTDASDPMGGQSGPVYRSELEVNFAVFRSGGLNPILDTLILDRPRANASDSLMDAMDREGNRVKHKLEKK
jgi:uncharacterized protein GlcG (DUF336 family)